MQFDTAVRTICKQIKSSTKRACAGWKKRGSTMHAHSPIGQPWVYFLARKCAEAAAITAEISHPGQCGSQNRTWSVTTHVCSWQARPEKLHHTGCTISGATRAV